MPETPTHVFERAGLGKPSYRCIGVSREVYRATPDSPAQPATCCDYCGTGIMYVYRVRSSDGRVFKVGSDCIARTGDAGLIRERKAVTRQAAQEKRAETARVRGEARQAQWAAEAEARRPAFEARFGELLKLAEPFFGRSDFIKDVCTKCRAQARMSDAQAEAVENALRRMIADDTARVASTHVGKVGERIERKVTVARVASFDRPVFGRPDRRETVWVITMRDADGNSIVSKSPNFYWSWQDGQRRGMERGDVFVLRGTVKEHSEYKGEKQTIVQRCTVKGEIEVAKQEAA